MYVGAALSDIVKIIFRSKNIVVHNIRAVCHLHHQIPVVAVIQVFAHPRPLRLPVKPCAKGAVVDIVVVNLYVDCSVELDSRDFIAEILMLHRNIINMVSVNLAEHAAHMTHNSVLPAVVNHIVADNMGADGFLTPSDMPRPENRLHLILIARLSPGSGTQVMSCRLLLADTDTAAFCVMDSIIFNYPALAPVCPQKPRLVGCGQGQAAWAISKPDTVI